MCSDAHTNWRHTVSVIWCISSWFCTCTNACTNQPLCFLCICSQQNRVRFFFFYILSFKAPFRVWRCLVPTERTCMLCAVGSALKPRCQLDRSHFDPRRFILIWYTVYRVQKTCVVWRHSARVCLCVFLCVSQQLWSHTRDMKAINLGFSHGSADAQNRFQQKEKEEKYNCMLGSSE